MTEFALLMKKCLMCQTVNRHNYGPHKFSEYNHVSPKINIKCTLMKDKVTGPFFFAEHLISGKTSLTMLKNIALSHTHTGTNVQTGLCTTSLLPLLFWTSGMAEGSYSTSPSFSSSAPTPHELYILKVCKIYTSAKCTNHKSFSVSYQDNTG